jgi:F-type H+-transporting ATPase subunit b
MCNRIVRRTKLIALTTVLAFACIALQSAPLMAAEAKTDIMPPVTGDGSGQTYAQAVWVMIIFVILLAILYPTAWKNVLAGLKKREEKIRASIAEADLARVKGEAALKEYNAKLATAESQIRDLLSNATVEAEKIAAGIRTRAQQESEEIKEKALKEIESSKQQALSEIYEQTATLATAVAEKILKRSINADDQRDLVKQSLDELHAVHV